MRPNGLDQGRIVQVLGNLRSNAARHSRASSPIRVGAARDGVHVAMRPQSERFDTGARSAPKAARIVSTASEVRPWSRSVQIPVAAGGPFAVEPTNFPETDALPVPAGIVVLVKNVVWGFGR